MWPLTIILLFATAAAPAPQQASSSLDGAYIGKVPQIKSSLGKVAHIRGLQRLFQTGQVSPDELQVKNTCYAIRSYHFERHDGQAPLLTGMTTCTPGRILEQKRVSPAPGLYVPLSFEGSDRRQP